MKTFVELQYRIVHYNYPLGHYCSQMGSQLGGLPTEFYPEWLLHWWAFDPDFWVPRLISMCLLFLTSRRILYCGGRSHKSHIDRPHSVSAEREEICFTLRFGFSLVVDILTGLVKKPEPEPKELLCYAFSVGGFWRSQLWTLPSSLSTIVQSNNSKEGRLLLLVHTLVDKGSRWLFSTWWCIKLHLCHKVNHELALAALALIPFDRFMEKLFVSSQTSNELCLARLDWPLHRTSIGSTKSYRWEHGWQWDVIVCQSCLFL